MDLIKIGKYIAEKRKEIGLTQKQLAEKLGMSDKSVSKWERGICLPDVSIYMELCDILHISINEFLLGEDIAEENLIKKSEYNLIQITSDSKQKQKNLKKVIVILSLITIIIGALMISTVIKELLQPQNYIVPVDRNSTEMKTAELLSGADGAFMFDFYTKDRFKALTVFMSEYQSGTLIAKSKIAEFSYDDMEASGDPESSTSGQIVFVPDFEKFSVKTILTDENTKYSTTFPILENAENKEYYGRTATQIEEKTPIQFSHEQGLVALIYGKDGVSGTPISEIENEKPDAVNDFVYYLSFEFCK